MICLNVHSFDQKNKWWLQPLHTHTHTHTQTQSYDANSILFDLLSF